MENPPIQTPTPVVSPTNPEHPLYQPPVQEPQDSSKTALFTSIALVILAVIIIVTLYLYFQNKNLASNNAPRLQNTTQTQPATNQAQAVNKEDAQKLAKYGVICKQFTSVEQALKTPEIACGLNLSNQNLSTLPDISKLTNLNAINLSNNAFTTFPVQLLKFQNLYSIDLSNNQISELPNEVFKSTTLQSINLSGNPIQNKQQSNSSNSAQLHIEY